MPNQFYLAEVHHFILLLLGVPNQFYGVKFDCFVYYCRVCLTSSMETSLIVSFIIVGCA